MNLEGAQAIVVAVMYEPNRAEMAPTKLQQDHIAIILECVANTYRMIASCSVTQLSTTPGAARVVEKSALLSGCIGRRHFTWIYKVSDA